MRYMNKVLMLVILLSLLCTYLSQAKVFYVSPTGNDDNPGTAESPWKSPAASIAKATLYMQQNTRQNATVIFLPGIYHSNTKINIQPTPGRLTLKASVIGEVIFDGGTYLENLQEVRDVSLANMKMYKTILPADAASCPIVAENFRLEIYANGQRLHPARYPNTGFITIAQTLGHTVTPKNSIKEGLLLYDDNNLQPLCQEKDAWLHGFWFYDWADSYQKISAINTKRRVIALEGDEYGYGFKSGARFYALNAFSFLDDANEYYLDRDRHTLYWIASNETLPSRYCLTIADFKNDYMLEAVGVSNLTIDGITFRYGNRAINILDGRRNIVSNCHILQMTSDAVHFQGGREHQLNCCLIEHIGGNGLMAIGGDRKTPTPSAFSVTDNIFRDISYYLYTFRRAVYFNGCGLNISHNYFTDMPASAIRIDGNDVTVDNNLFEQVVKESDDQGAFDMHFNPSYRGIVIKNNYWKNIGNATRNKVAAIRLDDMISGENIHDNFFDQCGSQMFGAIHLFGGKDNRISHNTFYRCPTAISCTPYGTKWKEELNTTPMHKKLYSEVDINSSVYQNKYSELKHSILANPDQNYITRNVLVGCTNSFVNTDKSIINSNRILKNGTVNRDDSKYGPINNHYQ